MAVAHYSGKPYTGKPLPIPGKLYAVHYDLGGEGVAFHDNDTVNPGSGGLNPGESPLDKFRINEPVGITYTKPAMDIWQDSKDPLPLNELYVGWTAPGEWVNYTVHVAKAGKYKIKAKMSSNNVDAQIRLSFGGTDKTGMMTIRSTTHWHTWNIFELPVVELAAGEQVMRLEFVKEGQMNVMWLEFTPV
jgi:hypothetical protein